MAMGGVLVVAFAAYVYTFVRPFELWPDNQAYFLLAKGLMSGQGYAETWLPTPLPANHFPPGYPVLLALWMSMTGPSVFSAKVLSGMAFGVTVLATYGLGARLTHDPRIGVVASAAVAVHAVALRYGSLVMSTMPFTALSMLALYAVVRARGTERPMAWRWLLGAVVLMSAAYYVRSIGLFLVAAVVLGSAARRRWAEAAWVGGGFGAAALPWFLYGRSLGGNTYAGAFFAKDWHLPEAGRASVGDFASRVMSNASSYFARALPEALAPGYEAWTGGWAPLVAALTVALVGVAVWGLYSLPAMRLEVGAYLGLTAAILLLWASGWAHVRFLAPLVPVLVLLLTWGGYTLLRTVAAEEPSPYLLLPLLALSLIGLPAERRWAQQPDGHAQQNTRRLIEQARRVLPADAVIAARNEASVAYFTERQTVYLAGSKDADLFIDGLRTQGADYVWLDEAGQAVYWQYVAPIIDAHPGHFELVARAKGLRNFEAYGRPLAAELYRFYPDGDGPLGGEAAP